MKNYSLILTIRVEVASELSLSKAMQELEQETDYHIGNTANVKVLETEILESFIPNS